MANGERSPSAARGLYLLVLFGAFVLDVGFAVAFVLLPVDFCLTSREAVDYVDLSFVYVRLGAALAACACGFIGFSLALRPVRDERRAERAAQRAPRVARRPGFGRRTGRAGRAGRPITFAFLITFA